MKPVFFILATVSITLYSCTTSKSPLFRKITAHEKYGNSLKNAGLAQTAIGKDWFIAAEKGLQQPQKIQIPFEETGYFAAETPSAAGYLFDVKRGEKIHVYIRSRKDTSAELFAEIYRITDNGQKLLQAFNNIEDTIGESAKADGKFLIRVQPELLVSLEYTIHIISGPSLAFPVDSSGNPRFISYWGAGRDAGARKHEGVDIRAKFRTPALAAADGTVFRVGNNRLGGKIVFLRDSETGNNLYYAHLDSQIAKTGQTVKIGDTLGLIGKTGNAINTVPHLHFGIYTEGGAVNPYPFIDPKILMPKKISAPLTYLNEWIRALSPVSIYESADLKASKLAAIGKNEVVKAVAATVDWYKIITPTGITGYIKSRNVTDKPLHTKTVASTLVLMNAPNDKAIPKAIVKPETSITVLGKHKKYQLIKSGMTTGWTLFH